LIGPLLKQTAAQESDHREPVLSLYVRLSTRGRRVIPGDKNNDHKRRQLSPRELENLKKLGLENNSDRS
jgi:hypothetical protein